MSFSMNEKMTVRSYSDPKFEQELKDVEPFVVHVNPENYTQSTQINFSDEQAQGTSGKQNNHNNTEPLKMTFDFLLDRTGALGNESDAENGVKEDIDHFRKVALDMEGEIHKPRYLKLCWGALIFKCQLEKLDIEYKLFNKEGKPLRATLKCEFREFKEDEQRVKEENKQSPDLSHVRIAEAGDSLPLMCFKIYGDSKYYLEVARANELTHFRTLKQGQRLLFPPLDKTVN
ncbi:LysM peptidoglycan-binding domain-containing protein [Flavobacteriaceae bacterium R33]|uniref:LysM peptidoglycan-binding domain-containing protein n=2 Tax=Poritiphilus flavus TaxID=2697053 RepID=A0A6L9EI28_9FLAO|nr:LysM peptidoglycan-binding domain-containing protein [Poritiphilus flavus]